MDAVTTKNGVGANIQSYAKEEKNIVIKKFNDITNAKHILVDFKHIDHYVASEALSVVLLGNVVRHFRGALNFPIHIYIYI